MLFRSQSPGSTERESCGRSEEYPWEQSGLAPPSAGDSRIGTRGWPSDECRGLIEFDDNGDDRNQGNRLLHIEFHNTDELDEGW